MVQTLVDPSEVDMRVRASQQWYSRPNDQRFLTLDSLMAHVKDRRQRSSQEIAVASDLTIGHEFASEQDQKGTIFLETDKGRADFTHWSFGQLCQTIGAPLPYMRNIRADVAYINAAYMAGESESGIKSLMLETDENRQLRALNSPTYGRIWDYDIAQKVQDLQERSGGKWQIPYATYAHRDPLRATTLYASDRDIFIFLVDPTRPIDVDGESLFRGFMVWNSEVGKGIFGLTTFFYQRVCDNRTIWGAKDVKELRIRHTKFGPDRFHYEAAPMLERYAESSASGLVSTIKQAKRLKLADTIAKVEEVLRNKGLTKEQATGAMNKVHEENSQHDPKSAWAVVNGVTAYAREMKNTDSRVKLETVAGEILDLAAESVD